MHQILLASALAAAAGLFGTSRSTCSTGQCGVTYAPVAPAQAVVYQAAPQAAAPVQNAAPAMVQAPGPSTLFLNTSRFTRLRALRWFTTTSRARHARVETARAVECREVSRESPIERTTAERPILRSRRS